MKTNKIALMMLAITSIYNNGYASSTTRFRVVTPTARQYFNANSGSIMAKSIPAAYAGNSAEYSTMVKSPYKLYSLNLNSQNNWGNNADQDRSFITWRDVDNLKRETKNLLDKFGEEEYRAEILEEKANEAQAKAYEFGKKTFNKLQELEKLTAHDVDSIINKMKQKSMSEFEKSQNLTPEQIKRKANRALSSFQNFVEDKVDETQGYLQKLNKKYEQEDQQEWEEFRKWRQNRK